MAISIPLPPVPLPAHLVDVAREYADGTRAAAEPRNAATVVLLRPSVQGPEVYLLRRHTTMDFAGGMCVFPGGGVDPRDFDASVAWAGPTPGQWATWLGVEEETARALVCAAVRETFEESGVLLAGPSEHSVVDDTTGDDWEADRHALESRELAMTELLTRRGLVLRTDLLGVWGGWLTPVFEPKRYRTWFFVAAMPPGQRTRDVSTESVDVTWLPALAADLPHLPRDRPVRHPRRGARRGPGARGRDVHARHRAARRRVDPLDARPPAAAGRDATGVTAGW